MKQFHFAALAFLLALAPIEAFNSSVSISKNLTAVDSALTVQARGFNSVSYQLSGTWNATVKFEGTVNSTTWKTVYAVNQTGGAVDSVATANGVYLLSGNGFLWIRARVSAYTSGTVAIQAITNEGSGVVSLLNQSSAGASSNVAVTSSALPTGAATAANQTNGNQVVQLVDSAGSKIGSTSHALNVNITGGASSGAVAQGSTTSGQTGGLTQAAVTTAAPSYTTGQTSPLSMDVSGGLRVASHAVTYATTGSGTATGALRVELPTNGTGTIATVGAVTAITNALPAGSAIIGKIGIDQTTPGTTNGVVVNSALPAGSNTIGKVDPGTASNFGVGATGSAVPANAVYHGANSSGNLMGLIQADNSVKIDVSTATTTQLVALTSGKKIYVTSWDVVAAGTGTLKLVYGTGSSCGTGTTDLTGAYSLVAQSGLAKGNGLGPVLVVPASNALCVTTSAAVGMQGSVAYTQF